MTVPILLPGPRPLQPLLAGALFASVGAFIADQALSPDFARVALHAAQRDRLWSCHWPELRRLPPHELRTSLCFVLACELLGLDAAQGLRFAGQARQPARWMRLFLADHGLLPYAALDPPEAPGPALSRRRTTGASAPRPGAVPA